MIVLTIPPSDAPLLVLARHNGQYVRPITAYYIDFRLEDNPSCDLRQTMRLDSNWIARHPLAATYIICVHGHIKHTHASRLQLDDLIRSGILSRCVYELPTNRGEAWWEWTMCLDNNSLCVKAPKRPRLGELTPEQVDESCWPYQCSRPSLVTGTLVSQPAH